MLDDSSADTSENKPTFSKNDTKEEFDEMWTFFVAECASAS
jgi:hypothetical protein